MRAMNGVVCVKQIPDPASPGQLDPTDHTLVRQGKLILDAGTAHPEVATRLDAGDANNPLPQSAVANANCRTRPGPAL